MLCKPCLSVTAALPGLVLHLLASTTQTHALHAVSHGADISVKLLMAHNLSQCGCIRACPAPLCIQIFFRALHAAQAMAY